MRKCKWGYPIFSRVRDHAGNYPCFVPLAEENPSHSQRNYINLVATAAIIFVPSKGGRSHVEVDELNWDDCEKGANVLLHIMLKSTNEK